MTSPLRHTPDGALIVGWDFSTGAVKAVAFDLSGNVVADCRLPTDLWTADGVAELSLLQLEGQAIASTRQLALRLKAAGRLQDWKACGISATHHTCGRIDADHVPVRRAICWNDETLARFRELGEARLARGPGCAMDLIGGPWADRYSLSHLVKDEAGMVGSADAQRRYLSDVDWQRTWRILPHGTLTAGYLTGNFDVISVSSAASTGMMDLRTNQWRREMLEAIESKALRDLAWNQLPTIVDDLARPVGALKPTLALEHGMVSAPLVFPTSDDQQAGLVGGGAVDDGQLAIILGNSAVVNSSSRSLLNDGTLDVMKLNWGPHLWMRCYYNGAQFLNSLFGEKPDWKGLETAARQVSPGCDGRFVLPFVKREPSVGVMEPRFEWIGGQPASDAVRFRAALEALAYLIELGVAAHVKAGQDITQVTVSGGIAQSDLMCEILATVLDRPIRRLASSEGPALGAAVTALAGYETYRRRIAGETDPFTVGDAVKQLVRFAGDVAPVAACREVYKTGRLAFAQALTGG